MKIVIVSDIHGNYKNMLKVLHDNVDFEYLFILGDILLGHHDDDDGYDPDKLIDLLNKYKDKIVAVRGNCDYFYNDMFDFKLIEDYICVDIDNIKFLLTHGHIFNDRNYPKTDFDVMLFGHTHVPCVMEDGNKLILNPGSITYPKNGSNKSYIIYENGLFKLKELDTGNETNMKNYLLNK